MLVAEHLIVGAWNKFIAGSDACVSFCSMDARLNVKKLTTLMNECFVEVDEKCPLLLENGAKIVL